MKNIKSVDVEDLIACFFGESETLYRFLGQKHGVEYVSGLSTYIKNRQIIKGFESGKALIRPFVATVRYEKNEHALEINFYEETHSLSCYVVFDQFERIALEDILKAAKKTHIIHQSPRPLSDPSSIEIEMEHLAKLIKGQSDLLFNADSKLIERATVIKETLMEHNLRKQLQENMQDACISAARAFMKKNYVRVIELLTPYRDFLSQSDLKKLRMARDKIKQGALS